MNILAKHIESLLLENDCVIVPGLGGFVASYVSARLVEDEGIFLPPHRQVGFNPLLQINDGLLVQSYMLAYDVNFPVATAIINEAVNVIKADLQNKGEMEIGSVGRLRLGIDGRYDFTPNEAGILSPELYALDALPLSALAETNHQTKEETDTQVFEDNKEDEETDEEAGKTYILRINRYVVHYASAAVIALVFYILWATPITQAPSQSQLASILPTLQQVGAHKQSQKQVKATAQVQQPSPAAQTQASTASEQTSTAQVAQPAAQPAATANATANYQGFTLVLASHVTPAGAARLCEKLAEAGFKDAQVYQNKYATSVIFSRFASHEEAKAQLNNLRAQSEYFKDAWIYEF